MSKRSKPISHTWVDSTRAPMYVVRLPSPAPFSELLAFCATREEWAKTQDAPVAFVFDISRLTTKDASGRPRDVFIEHLKRFEEFDKKWTCAVGIVAGSAVTRGLVTAVFWLQSPCFEYCVVPTVEEAVVFTQVRLEIASRRRLTTAVA
ncbi:MAG TPA: hypothetical protein VI299_29180 [Polyangiales bacterium]